MKKYANSIFPAVHITGVLTGFALLIWLSTIPAAETTPAHQRLTTIATWLTPGSWIAFLAYLAIGIPFTLNQWQTKTPD